MTARERLAARYQGLLVAYPRDFRTERGPELVGTLLDLSGPGQAWPRVADAVDLIGAGVRTRMGRVTTRDLLDGAQIAAPVSIALSAGISAFLWMRVEPATSTFGPVAYAIWILAALAWSLPKLRLARLVIGLAIAVTATVPELSTPRTPLWVVMSLVAFGVIALAGTSPAVLTSAGRPDDRIAVPAGALGVGLIIGLLARGRPGYYQPTIAQIGIVVAVAVGVLGVVALRRANARWWWATLLVALPGGWLGPIGGAVADPATMPVHFGHLAEVMLGSTVVVGAVVALGTRPLPARVVASVAVGSALGLTAFGSAIGGMSWWTWCTCAGLLAAMLLGRPHIGVTAASAFGTVAVAFVVGAYNNDWTGSAWRDPDATMLLVSTLAVLPFALTGLKSVDSRRPAAMVALAVSAAWIGRISLPYALRWGPVLLVLSGLALAAAAQRLWPR